RPPSAGAPAPTQPHPPVDSEGPDAPPADAGSSTDDNPTPPTTGDPVVDAATAELAEAQSGPLSERIAAGERAHRVLRERLDDLSDRGPHDAHGSTPSPGRR
ncbi:MAG: hypothetical protein JWP82_1480, partial [Humibacillus sp.]|nr:hypothetical protein [Humibacillus sp.]